MLRPSILDTNHNMDTSLSIRRVSASNIHFYKVVGGSDVTLHSYNASQSDDHDWSALYTQFRSDHALGTVPYRWERGGFTEATLIEAVILDQVSLLVMEGAIFHDPNVSGREKAIAIQRALALDPERPLMRSLGENGLGALIRETEDEWELILPHGLVRNLSLKEKRVARFRKHRSMPLTSHWCREGDDWEPWDDMKFPEMPDLDTEWIAAALR